VGIGVFVVAVAMLSRQSGVEVRDELATSPRKYIGDELGRRRKLGPHMHRAELGLYSENVYMWLELEWMKPC
jgi:hypothetical protein